MTFDFHHRIIEDQPCLVTALEFSPCVTWLAVGDNLGRVRVFACDTGNLLQPMILNGRSVTSLCWQPSLTGHPDILFGLEDGRAIQVSPNHQPEYGANPDQIASLDHAEIGHHTICSCS